MKNHIIFALFTLISCNAAIAQFEEKDVLFTVDNDPVYIEEFNRVYNKNLDLVKDESQKDIDAYLELFVNFKLKLKEAKALKLDEKPTYKREFASYRKQLASNYLTDINVTEALVKEAYDRMSYEIRASHILIRVPENAAPADTLMAYNKIVEAKNKIAKGEDFEVVAKEYSQDPSVSENGGDLGYFGGFRMVYAFENAAFNTKVGEVSDPFKTRFGYHIVKVFDKRKSQGERTIAHIMVAIKKDQDSLNESAETRINDIYKKLLQGEKFESLAKQFSEDKASATKGGLLNRFGKGQLSSPQIEEAAFNIQNKNDFTKPIKTDFGWHIIKLIDKHPVLSFEEMKNELEAKIKRDSRSAIINTAFSKKLKNYYKIADNQEALDYFAGILNEDIHGRNWKIPEDLDKEKQLFTVGNKVVSYEDFAEYLLKNQGKWNTKKPFNSIINESYEDFLNAIVLQYHEDNLENENEDFAMVVEEYRDGLLLFDLMETEVWNASKNDSLGVQEFFRKNASDYYWPKRIVGSVASTADKGIIKKVSKMLIKGLDPASIKDQLNKDGKLNVIFTRDTMNAEHQALPKSFEFKKGVSEVYEHNDAYVVVKVDNILESSPKTFEEARGKVISDYQNYIEKNWLESLRNKYKVLINKEALKEIKEKLNN